MVGDGINDAPVSNPIHANVAFSYHLSEGINSRRHRRRHWVRK